MGSNKIFCFLLILFTSSASAGKLPSTFKTCQYKSSDFQTCLMRNVEDAVQQLTHPIKEVNLPRIDPLELSRLDLDAGSGPVSVKQSYTDVKYSGLSKLKVKSVNLSLDDGVLDLELLVPMLQQDSNYRLDGKLLIMPVQGEGRCQIRMTNVRLTAHVDFHMDMKHGKKYLRIDKIKANLWPQDAYLHFDNLFKGNKEMGDNINKVINENWEQILAEILPSYSDALGQTVAIIANNLFEIVPVKDIFLGYE